MINNRKQYALFMNPVAQKPDLLARRKKKHPFTNLVLLPFALICHCKNSVAYKI